MVDAFPAHHIARCQRAHPHPCRTRRPAAREVVDAVDEHQTFVREATSARTEADRTRRQADSLTNEADLP